MSSIFAIDPGPEKSAFLHWDGTCLSKGFCDNEYLLRELRKQSKSYFANIYGIEMIASYGMPVGKEVFETVLLIGRMLEILQACNPLLVYRKDIKMHLCGSMRAKDGNVRQALIDRIGPQGKKKTPGPTYGLAGHDWSTLAIAVYIQDKFTTSSPPGFGRAHFEKSGPEHIGRYASPGENFSIAKR